MRASESSAVPEAVEPKHAEGDGSEFLNPAPTPRPASRAVAPAPEATSQNIERLKPGQAASKSRRKNTKVTQCDLPLEIVSKGRFEKSDPTIRNGADLDYPTFVRKGVVLN